MTIARLHSAGIDGVESYVMHVEADIGPGLPVAVVVGLPDLVVREARDRVKAALKNSNVGFPNGRVTVNLSPARRRKDGVAFDLPIALGIAAAKGELPVGRLREVAALGELSLAGNVLPVRGALAAAEALERAGVRTLLIARKSAPEAALVGGRLEVIPVDDLVEAMEYVKGKRHVAPARVDAAALLAESASPADRLDLAQVRGCFAGKRATVIAAAGGHDLLLIGPPGAGKTMLARRLPGILPALDVPEAMEITRIHGIIGVARTGLVRERPFRAPHHTISYAGLVGGGTHGPRPGEISLAHRGVLFLDELAEFAPRALEALREPLETRRMNVARAWGSVELPADFQLVAATNPCPCGFLGDPRRDCRCGEGAKERYRGKLSGPLLDRIDLQVVVRPLEPDALVDSGRATADPGLATAEAAAQVAAARERQRRRWRALVPEDSARAREPHLNARVPDTWLAQLAPMTPEASDLLLEAATSLALSARGIVKTRRVARTIADLAGRDVIEAEHVTEALQFRRFEPSPRDAALALL